MATEERAIGDATVDEAEVPRTRRVPYVSYDARLGASCMLWFMIVGIGILIGIILIWGASNLSAVFR
jgi:hypothetical protein